jgi:hypothetical protein
LEGRVVAVDSSEVIRGIDSAKGRFALGSFGAAIGGSTSEDYLGSGPWKIMRFVFPLKYEDTPDASSPRSLRSLDREFLLLTKESDRLARSPNGVHLTCAAADLFLTDLGRS